MIELAATGIVAYFIGYAALTLLGAVIWVILKLSGNDDEF